VWPLLDTLLRRLQFLRLQSLFVMTPICHAAGLSAALMAFAFGKKVVLQSRLHIDKAFALIDQHQIDTLNAVPTILYRLLNHKIGEDQSINNMVSVKRLVCGSAPLSANLYRDFHAMFPHIGIYNVYGSSETGMNILATPNDLAKHPDSAGRVIKGVKIKILGQNGQTLGINETGVLWSRCAWSAHAMQWLQSGDLAYQDDNGYVYLKGRVDDMLICGGVNVYPVDLENIVLTHPDIIQAKAYAVVDGEYGQCMSVQVVLHQRAQSLDSEGIALWLSDKAPRYLRPASIMIVQDLATDNIGKVIVH
jgi:acyl-CoA synthetase (AMP-forming)/AMP-acid ligase II